MFPKIGVPQSLDGNGSPYLKMDENWGPKSSGNGYNLNILLRYTWGVHSYRRPKGRLRQSAGEDLQSEEVLVGFSMAMVIFPGYVNVYRRICRKESLTVVTAHIPPNKKPGLRNGHQNISHLPTVADLETFL